MQSPNTPLPLISGSRNLEANAITTPATKRGFPGSVFESLRRRSHVGTAMISRRFCRPRSVQATKVQIQSGTGIKIFRRCKDSLFVNSVQVESAVFRRGMNETPNSGDHTGKGKHVEPGNRQKKCGSRDFQQAWRHALWKQKSVTL